MAITYTPSVNFGAKDSLPLNDPSKVIKGSEFSTEFTAIQTAFGLAAPAASPTFTGTVTISSVDINGGTIDGVTIGGSSAGAGSFTTLTASGDVNFDSGTFFVDASADAVGIGTTSPGESLETNGNIQIKYAGSNADPSGARYLYFNNTDTTLVADQPLGGLSWINNDASATAGEAAYVKAYATTNTGRAELRFGTGDQNAPAQAMVIDASGNVGIGTTSPGRALDVQASSQQIIATFGTGNTTQARLSIADANTTTDYVGIGADTDDFTVFAGGSERIRVDDVGNVGIGTSSPAQPLHVQTTGGNLEALRLDNASVADATGIYLRTTGEAAISWGTNGFLAFYGSGPGNTERMRIDSSGNLLVGTTSVSTDPGVQIFGAGNIFTHIAGTAGADSMRFYRNSVEVGSITTTGTTTTYNTSSDARLKENIADAEDAGAKVDAIQVRQFDWKADGSHQDYGMVAQELLTVAPEAVSGDPESDDMMGVDYSKLVPMMLKEIQSLRARVAQLEGA